MQSEDSKIVDEFGSSLVNMLVSLIGSSVTTSFLKYNFPGGEVLFDDRGNVRIKSDDVRLIVKMVAEKVVDKVVKDFGYDLSEALLLKTYRRLEKKYPHYKRFHEILNLMPERSLEAEKVKLFSRRTLEDKLLSRTKELEELNAGLEKQVVQRTKELVSANEKLEETNTNLKQLSQEKSEFLSMVSHQIQTPLTGVKWSLSELKDSSIFQPGSQELKYLDYSLSNNEKIIQLVSNLLNVARIEEKRFFYNFQKMSIRDVVSGAVQTLSLLAKNKSVVLDYFPDEDQAVFLADKDKMYAAMENLIENAIKYSSTSKDAVVTVRIKAEANKAVITIKDNGIGISKEDQSRLFTKFFRASNAVEKNIPGSGLGLFIVKRIIEDHGGLIFLQSENNKGATFTVELPLVI